MKIIKDKNQMKHIITYGFFGVLTTVISFGSFYVLKNIFVNTDENILNTISIFGAIIFAYFTNRKYVFKSAEKNIYKEFIKFVGSRAFSTIFEIIIFFIFNTIFQVEGMTAKILVSIGVIILNYITSKMFVFKIRNNKIR